MQEKSLSRRAGKVFIRSHLTLLQGKTFDQTEPLNCTLEDLSIQLLSMLTAKSRQRQKIENKTSSFYSRLTLPKENNEEDVYFVEAAMLFLDHVGQPYLLHFTKHQSFLEISLWHFFRNNWCQKNRTNILGGTVIIQWFPTHGTKPISSGKQRGSSSMGLSGLWWDETSMVG